MMDWVRDQYGPVSGSYTMEVENSLAPIIDPSGYVYEAVMSNRVEGAEATVWQKETKLDLYDEPYEEVSQWDAEAYSQVNPQTTNAKGEFAWDVPDGLWQVRVTKAGYEAAETEWMAVPPERKDVHIPLVSYDKPYVRSAELTDEGIEVTFEKYVMADQLGNAFALTVSGETVEVTVSSIDAEQSPEGAMLVRQALLTPERGIQGAGNAELTVKGDVQSYAGISVGEDMIYDVKLKRYELNAPEAVVLLKGAREEIAVAGKPKLALAGKALSAEVDSDAAEVEAPEALDEDGKATVRVKALVGGEAVLRLSVEGATAEVRVTCVDPDVYESVWLPIAISEIDAEAFAGSGAEIVVIPASCASIGSRAFADCPNLKYVVFQPGAEVAIAADAFQGSDPVFLYEE